MEAAPIARGFFVGDYEGLTASAGFVPLFVMTNCSNPSCTATGTLDGSPAGPDSTDVFSSTG
jgi:hypothetical protein